MVDDDYFSIAKEFTEILQASAFSRLLPNNVITEY